ncbi:arylamine N-acetyltransferase [Streptosporangium algeriense]|uniref:Arylamine N-acetyltransferase n=1 Tax=Streptosporangium algeriense TaxID=1682748 RepID=A0ABW3DTW7_9ACTN
MEQAGRGWDSEALDLAAYLARISYEGDLAPTVRTLRALQRAHSGAIPFENLEIILGRPIPLDLEALQDKMVRGARGGYCYEHTRLLAAALERLGFGVTGLAARVRMGSDRLRAATHALLLVEVPGSPGSPGSPGDGGNGGDSGSRWICDIGFGEGPIEPIELAEGTESAQGGWRFRLDRLTPQEWVLRSLRRSAPDSPPDSALDSAPGSPSGSPQGSAHGSSYGSPPAEDWLDLHSFTLDPRHPVDYVVINHYISTHPNSPFVSRPVVRRPGPEVLYGLTGTMLTAHRPDGSAEERRLEPGEVPKVLAETFGVRLGPADAAALVARLS